MDALDNNSMDRMQILPIHQRWKMLMVTVTLTLIGQLSGIIQAIKINNLLEKVENGDTSAGVEIVRI